MVKRTWSSFVTRSCKKCNELGKAADNSHPNIYDLVHPYNIAAADGDIHDVPTPLIWCAGDKDGRNHPHDKLCLFEDVAMIG